MPPHDVESDFGPAIDLHFGDLLSENRFCRVAGMNYGGEHQMTVFASPLCQVKFLYEAGYMDVLFGRPDAPRQYSDHVDGVRVWFSAGSAWRHEDGIHPGLAFRLVPGPAGGEPGPDAYLRSMATILRPYMDRLAVAFSSNPPPGWWDGFSP